MNPSYDNSFGSQNAGGTTPGANPGAAMSQSAPQTPPQPVPNMGMPISSGTGDVVLNNSASSGSKKGLIIGGIVILLLAIIGAVAYFLLNNGGGVGGNTSSSLQASFNSYANYVLYGEENDAEPNLDNLDEAPYFEDLESEQISEYVKIADTKYDALAAAYNEDEWEIDITSLRAYFETYPTIESFDFDRVLELYNSAGANGVQDKINELYDTEETELFLDANLENYLTALADVASQNLNYIVAAEEKGCLQNGVIPEGCYVPDAEEEAIENQIEERLTRAIIDMQNNAFDTLISLKNAIYGVTNEESEEVIEEEATKSEETTTEGEAET